MRPIEYLKASTHPITIAVIGAGGNGSQLLTQLARINHALCALGKKGLHVSCIDDDIVTESNVGRQLFSISDIGKSKAVVLISRLNAYFGSNWRAYTDRIQFENDPPNEFVSNIVISCTDNKKSRLAINHWLKYYQPEMNTHHPIYKTYYWMDIGNKTNIGQVIMGSVFGSNLENTIPGLLELFPDYSIEKEDIETPACSLAEALIHQQLFVNTFVSNVAAQLIWELLTEDQIFWYGAFINLKTMNIKKIKCH